jgi:hypothetical protein
VLANEAAASGLVAYQRIDSNVDPGGLSSVRYPSQWLVMARQAQALEGLPQTPGWERLEGRRGAAVWTDDFSNVLSVTRLR